MSDFPKWLLTLAFLCLLPILLCPFYLFGERTFGTSENTIFDFLFYCVTQLLWVAPTAGFFFSLDAWRRGYEKLSLIIVGLSVLTTIGGLTYIFC